MNSNKPIKLYYFPASEPARTVRAVLEKLNIKYEIQVIDILKGEQFTPEYLKINPQSLVPAIDDNGFILTEAEAIVRYLINTRAGSDKVYPTDTKKRAVVDRYMPFHHNTIRPAFHKVLLSTYPFLFPNKHFEIEASKKEADSALKQFNDHYLQGKKYISGDSITIADIFALNQLSNVYLVTDYDFGVVPAVKDYIERLLKDPILEEVNKEIKGLNGFLRETLAKTKKQ